MIKNFQKLKTINSPGAIYFIYAIALFMLGSVWALSSPVSSAADDDYHLTSIWCQKGSQDYCERIDETSVLVPAELNTGKLPEKFTGMPPCYVTWPYSYQSAECIKSAGDGKSYSDRINTSINSKVYYKVVSLFVSEEIENSVLRIRFFNLFIFCSTIFLLFLVSLKQVSQKIILAISLAIIPVGIFFIASTNPISWSITSIITNSIFLMRILQNIKSKQKIEKLAVFGYFLTGFLGVSSRLDSVFYLTISNLAVIILFLFPIIDKFKILNNKYTIKFIQVFFSIFIFIFMKLFLEFYHGQKIVILNSTNDVNNPHPIINILIELPGFVLGIIGGQEPRFYQNRGTLGRDFTFGVGWLEYNFLSITGIFIGAAVVIAIFSHLGQMNLRKKLIVNLYLTSFLSLIIIERALWGYLEGAYFQPRYFVGLFISFLTMLFISEQEEFINFSKNQINFIFMLLSVGGIIAWRLVLVRYTSGLNYPITNLNIPITWNTRILDVQQLFMVGLGIHLFYYYLSSKFIKFNCNLSKSYKINTIQK